MRDEPTSWTRRLLLPCLGALIGLTTLTSCGSSSSSSSDGPTTPPPLPPAQAERPYFGVHDSSLGSLQPGTGVGSLRIWDAGVAWYQVETGPGQYDWSALDRIVSAAQKDHAEVTYVLAMTPGFYAKDPTKPPGDLSAYRKFVTAVMSRYKDFHGSRGISSYQVWNEANVVNFWSAGQQEMAQLTKIVHDVRDKVDPDAQVVAPPMAVRLEPQQDWLAKYYATKVGGQPVWKYVDDLAFNLYPLDQYNGVPGTPERAMDLLSQVRARLSADGVPESMPIWNTEVNYGLKSGGPAVPHAKPIPASRQAAYIVRTYLLNAADGVRRVFWYRWDWGLLDPSIGGGTLGNTVLTDPENFAVRTEAGRALALVSRWMTLDDAQAPVCKLADGTYTCTIDHTSGTRYVYWRPDGGKAQVTAPEGAATRTTVTGATGSLSAGDAVTVTELPVMVDTSH